MNTKKHQVFISSTYLDLTEERDNIIKAILELYHIPIGMEMFSAEDEDQWEIIRRTIEVSDYYILILGLRYGSKTSEGVSFTQKEYEYALEKGIPILAFVMSDNVSLTSDQRDDDLTDIRNFRELVLTNSRMAQFWETKDQLIKNVSVSLMKQIIQKPGIGWVRGDQLGSEEALTKELTTLSKENRELRERIADLESKLTTKSPSIGLNIVTPKITDTFFQFEEFQLPTPIVFDNIAPHLLDFVTEDSINEYNNIIPTQSVLDKFNASSHIRYLIDNCSSPLVLSVVNKGSTKANNIYIDVIFPDDILVLETDKYLPDLISPLPSDPLVKAQADYDKKRYSLIHGFGDVFSDITRKHDFDLIPQYESFGRNLMPPVINKGWWIKREGQKLTIKVDDLLHTREIRLTDEFSITPMKEGTFECDVTIICEEYEGVDSHTICMNIER